MLSAIPEAPTKFTKYDVVQRLHASGIAADEKAVRTVLARLAEKGELIVIEAGIGRKLGIYQKNTKAAEEDPDE